MVSTDKGSVFPILSYVFYVASLPFKQFYAAFLTSPIFSWTWAGVTRVVLSPSLQEMRPSDVGSAIEMFSGRYLLASIAVETNGVSPFSVHPPSQLWLDELNSFHWLRHFQNANQPNKHTFVQSLTLDWIGRNDVKRAKDWTPSIVSRRILSWLRHYRMLIENAPVESVTLIDNSLQLQVEYLRARAGWAATAMENCYIQMALLGIALSRAQRADLVEEAASDLLTSLQNLFHSDGGPKSRNVTDLFEILLEIVSLRSALDNTPSALASPISQLVTKMLKNLRLVHHGDGSPIFFNGSRSLPVDILFSLLSHENLLAQSIKNDMPLGYARLSEGPALLIADASTSPPFTQSQSAHAGLASFEYSVGSELIVCNVGAAPYGFDDLALGFRLTSAHSSVMINDQSIGNFYNGSGMKKFFSLPEINLHSEVRAEENAITISSDVHAKKNNLHHIRNLGLLDGGLTLLGKDTFSVADTEQPAKNNQFAIRFHLNAGAIVDQSGSDDQLSIKLRNGDQWQFMCEGATIRIEPSIRVAPIHGLQQTFQIVLHGSTDGQHEVVWSFSKSTPTG